MEKQQPSSEVIVVPQSLRDKREERSEVLLPSLLGIHGVQNGLSFGGVALPELLDLPLHHGIQGSEPHLQLLKVQVLQLDTETETDCCRYYSQKDVCFAVLQHSVHRVEDVTHKVKVSVLWYLPVVGEDVLGLDVVAGLLLRLVVVVVLLLLGCLVRVLLVKIVHEGGTYGLLGGGVPCGGRGGRGCVSNHEGLIDKSILITHITDR